MSGVMAALLGQRSGATPVTGGSFLGNTITLAKDGTASGTSYTGPASWINPTGDITLGSQYWARTTIQSGAAAFSPTSGIWYSLTNGQTWSAVSHPGAATGIIEFALDAVGASIVASNSFSVNNTI